MITASIALIVCNVNMLLNSDKYVTCQILILYFIIWLLIILISSLLTIKASLNNDTYKENINNDNKNLLFYGNLSSLTEEMLLNKLYERYTTFNKPYKFTAYQYDLANQIIVNSRIATNKANGFNRSIKIIFYGLIFGIFILFYTV